MPEDIRDDTVGHPSNRRIANRYAVDRLLARGGMATVYLAKHVDLNRAIALKVLRPPDDADTAAAFEDRFRLEAKTLASLNHPNIVTLHDFGELDDGRFFLAMEFIDGPRLSDLMRQGPMDVQRTLGLILQVCQALRYAHDRGVIHRDLKPSNLMIQQYEDGSEHVKVVDFGLVKLTDADQTLTRAGLILGSPHCMSPEQVRGSDVDTRADVYAIGILLFRAITGRYPFHGANSAATMMAHLNTAAPALHSVNADIQIPEGLEGIIQRCLQKKPQDRFESMGELILALTHILETPLEMFRTAATQGGALQDVALAASLELSIARERERDRRYLLIGLLAAVVLGTLGLGAGWGLIQSLQHSPPVAETVPPDPATTPSAPPLAAPVAAPAMEATGEAKPDGTDGLSEDITPPAPPVTPEPTATPKPRRKPRATNTRPAAPAPAPTPAKTPTSTSKETPPSPDGYKGLPEDW